MRIVIPGGTGHLGQLLSRHFHDQGHEVMILSRHPRTAPWQVMLWTRSEFDPWASALDGASVLINLVGRSVDCRYTATNRRQILESRVESTTVLGRAVARCSNPPRLWLNASTATIYRHALDRDMDEETGEFGGNGFSVQVAKAWEQALFDSDTPDTRKVAMRSAMVMSPKRGGAFQALLRLVRAGLGGSAGPGTQFVSWIHDQDFLRAIDFLIDVPELEGPINLASPYPIPNSEFMADLRDAWGSLAGLNASPWMLEIGAFLLRTEAELILKSRRVVPGRLQDAGFVFEFPEWKSAAQDLVRRWRSRQPRSPKLFSAT